jgi:hypothetical protein
MAGPPGQLGHADPALTLRVYAHALPEEEHDLGFSDFGASKHQEVSTPGRAVFRSGA